MTKSNQWDGACHVCGVRVREGEGRVVADPDARRGFLILCPEHAPEAALEAPKPPEASKLPSIHLDEERYER
ncbi:MAG: hypothetical protein JWN10_2696 [Solirubrobacterales bacterium]|nr:hypothetical protein [Solirubrobacterales bacterium]